MDSTCGHFPNLRGLVGKLRGSQVTHWTHQKIGQSQRPFEEDQIFHLCLHIHSEDSDLLCQVMKRCDGCRVYSTMLICVIIFFSMLLFLHLNGVSVHSLFSQIPTAFGAHPINVTQINYGGITGSFGFQDALPDIPTGNFLPEIIEIRSHGATPIYVLFIHVTAAYLAYIIGKFACRIVIQGFSFAFPVTLTVPLAVTLLISGMCKQTADKHLLVLPTLHVQFFFSLWIKKRRCLLFP